MAYTYQASVMSTRGASGPSPSYHNYHHQAPPSHSHQYTHEQQQHHSPDEYRGYSQEMPRSYTEEVSHNMAGFGARRFAQKQEEARLRAEREQMMEEEARRRRAEAEDYERQERAMREDQSRWEEEQRMHRRAKEEQRMQRGADEERNRQREHGAWIQRQAEGQREQEREQQRYRAMNSSSSPLSRSVPLQEVGGRGGYGQGSGHILPGRSVTLETTASSDGRVAYARSQGNHQQSASTSTTASVHARSKHALLRETVYDDDYEEPECSEGGGDTLQSDGFGGMRIVDPVVAPSLQDQDELPMAKCADCGDSLPFEELIGHVCLNLSGCKSPLFSQSEVGTPIVESPVEVKGRSRSPFLQRYDQYETSGSRLGMQRQSATLPPQKQDGLLPVAAKPLRSNTSPPSSDPTADQVERARLERKKQIEEQRAAKRREMMEKDPKEEAVRTHHRAPTSLSSISTSSSSGKSSLLDSSHSLKMQTPSSACLTPSSSYENWIEPVNGVKSKAKEQARGAAGQARRLAAEGGKRAELDLGDIEGLMHDIHNHDTPRAKPKRMEERSTPRANQRPPDIKVPPAAPHKSRMKKCSVCLHTFQRNQPMVQKNGKIFCIDDYAELYLEKCRKCSRPVRDVGVRSQDGALEGIYHRDCFSCFRCNAAFEDGTFYVFDNAPYCSKHYHQLNGSTCHSCKEGIEGKCRQVETGERFHSRCLTCQYDNGREFCKDILKEYYLVKGRRLCEWHFGKVAMNPVESSKAAKRRTFVKTMEARKGKA